MITSVAAGWWELAAGPLKRVMEGPLGRVVATPLIPVAVAALLGLWRIGDKSLWLDEGLAIAVARLPTLDMLSYIWRVELHAGAYYLLLHPWLALGQSEAAVRALSVLFAVIAVLATWAIARRQATATAAALVLATAPAFVILAQEARTFGLAAAVVALASLALLRLLERWSPVRALAYVGVAGLTIYAHPFAALAVIAHAGYVALGRQGVERRRTALLYVPIAIGWLPMIRFALSHRDRAAEVLPLTLDLVASELLALGGGVAATIALGLAVAWGLRGTDFRRDLAALWLLVPPVGIVVLSLAIQPSLLGRYLLPVLPAAALIASRNRAWLIVAVIAVQLVGVWHVYEHYPHERYRDAAAWVSAAAQPGDGIVFAPAYLRPAFGYYARVGQPLHPPAAWSESDLLRGPPDLAAVAAADRIWLVEAHSAQMPPELAEALRPLSAAEKRDYVVKELRVTLLVRTPDR